MELRGFLRGHARGFLLNDLSRRRIMLPADSIAEAPDQQTERWTDCTIPGARLCAVTRDVEGSDGTLVRRGDSIVITERFDTTLINVILTMHSCCLVLCLLAHWMRCCSPSFIYLTIAECQT